MLIVDFVTKQVVMNNVDLYSGQIPVIPHFLNIIYSRNLKAAFGMGFTNPQVNRWLYIVFAFIASAAIIFFYVKKNKVYGRYIKACLMLILAGAIGNVIDRLFYKTSDVTTSFGVVDWIDFQFGDYHYATFNIADSCIVIGCIMLIVYLIVGEVKEYRANKATEPKVEGKVLSKEEQARVERNEEIDASEKVDN